MSLFKKTKWKAYAASSPLVDEDNMPGTIVGQIVNGVVKNDNLGERVAGATMIDLVSQARAATFYARSHYVHGTPTGSLKFFELEAHDIDRRIKNIISGWGYIAWSHRVPTDEEYVKFFVEKHLNEQWYGNKFLSWKQGLPKRKRWDPADPDMLVPQWDATAGEYKKVSNHFEVLADNNGRVVIQVGSGSNTYKTPGFNIPVADEFYIVRWKKPGNPRTYYWAYDPSTGVHPELEGDWHHIQAGKDFHNEFLPVAILMHDKVDFNEDPKSDLCKTTNRLLNKFNLDGDIVLEQIHDHELKKIQKWDAYVHFGVPIRTKYQGSRRYLYYFFDMLRSQTHHTVDDFKRYIEKKGDGVKQPFTDLTITEGGGGGYHAEYRWSFIDYTDVTHTLADPPDKGKVHMHYQQRKSGQTAVWRTELQKYYPQIGNTPRRNQSNEHDFVVMHYHDYEGVVHQLFIMGLSMRCMINTKEINGTGNARNRYFEATMFGDKEEIGEFIIPVNIGIMAKLPPIMAEEMLADSLHCTLFLVQKVKSYRGWFKWLVIIVAIIIIVLTWQYEFIPALAAAVAGSSAVLFYAAYIIISFLYSMLLTAAMAIVDSEIFNYVVLAVTLYFSAGGIQGIKDSLKSTFSSVKGAWSNLVQAPGMTSALSFVESVSSYIGYGWNIYEKRALADLERDFERLEQDHRDELEAIEAAWGGMTDAPSWLDPLDLVMRPSGMGFFEMPDTFYARLLNTNPGVISLQFPGTFYDRAMDLPETPAEGNITMDQFYDMQSMRGA